MGNMNRFPVPMFFVLVTLAVAFLFIFFGAWAVSSGNDSGRVQISLGSLNTDRTFVSESSVQPRDKWWGRALLATCPLH